MNSTSQNRERTRYLVILLLVVGLTAFSSAMKELNQLQQLTLDATRLIAQWSDKLAPAQVPQVPQATEIQHAAIKVETCELKQSLPSFELPWLSSVARTASRAPRAIVPRPSQVIDFKDLPKPGEMQVAKLKKFPQIHIDPVPLAFTITTDAEPEAVVIPEWPVTQFKAKTRKHREIRISPRDREVLLKSFNRSINLRFAS